MKKKLCIAIGDFDGVHLGHQQLLKLAVNNNLGLVPAVYTFFDNCKGSKIITTRFEKELLLMELGIKRIIFDDFEKVRQLTPDEFVENVIFNRLNAGMVVCGRDFRFGKEAAGNANMLETLCSDLGIQLTISDDFCFLGGKLSSSDIRGFISKGDMLSASQALGRNYSVLGRVTHGKHFGSENKVPTVNMTIQEQRVVPAYGVYITKTHIDSGIYNSITNVGVRPSVENSDKPNIETNIFDFYKDIYGKIIKIEFIKMIRPEIKFENSTVLYEQINRDVITAKKYFYGECK